MDSMVVMELEGAARLFTQLLQMLSIGIVLLVSGITALFGAACLLAAALDLARSKAAMRRRAPAAVRIRRAQRKPSLSPLQAR